MLVSELIASLGHEVEDPEEDSQSISIDVTVQGQDFIISQSPTVLGSKRQGGTTGAVLWKITPVFAEWISSKKNILWTSQFLSSKSIAVELGCGISGLLALSLAPSITHFIATDQAYVQKVLKENLETNSKSKSTARQPVNQDHRRRRSRKQTSSHLPPSHSGSPGENSKNITFASLDWETDNPDILKSLISQHQSTAPTLTPHSSSSRTTKVEDSGFDILLACDCIYNDALIPPFVRTCADICRLRPCFSDDDESEQDFSSSRRSDGDSDGSSKPTLCIIAQQLRSPEVFEEWLREALVEFRVWRVGDEVLGAELGMGSGYAVHALLLRPQ